MDLSDQASRIRDEEFKELFPEHSVQEILEDEDKMRYAVFQVHHTVWNENLYELVEEEDGRVEGNTVADTCRSVEEFDRVLRLLPEPEAGEKPTSIPVEQLQKVL